MSRGEWRHGGILSRSLEHSSTIYTCSWLSSRCSARTDWAVELANDGSLPQLDSPSGKDGGGCHSSPVVVVSQPGILENNLGNPVSITQRIRAGIKTRGAHMVSPRMEMAARASACITHHRTGSIRSVSAGRPIGSPKLETQRGVAARFRPTRLAMCGGSHKGNMRPLLSASADAS